MSVIYLISVFFCFFTAAIIHFRINTNKIFGVYLLVLYFILNGVTILFYFILETGILTKVPFLYKIFSPLTLLMMPLSYLYIRSTLYNENTFKRIDLVHLLPFIVFTINYLPFYFMPYEEKIALVNMVVKYPVMNITHQDGLLPEFTFIMSRCFLFFVYLTLIGLLLKKYYKHNTSANLHFLKIKKWVYTLFRLQIIYWVGLTILFLIIGLQFQALQDFNNFFNIIIATIISLFFIRITTYLLMNPILLLGLNKRLISKNLKQVKSVIDDHSDFKKIHDYVFNDNFYKDPTLNISKLSLQIKITSRNISIAISEQGFENFNDYVNGLRVLLAKDLLISNSLKNYSMNAIATNSGFNSISTFYRAFKKKNGNTPIEFLKKIKIDL